MGLPVNADVPMGGRHQNRGVKPAPQSTPVWATACLAALQGGQARRTARSSKTKHQNRTLTARKQRFLTAVHTLTEFQSTPVISGGRNPGLPASGITSVGFNPRPSFLAGETMRGLHAAAVERVSIHARHFWRAKRLAA